ncbi:MAG: NADH dehydrogenase (quinone) subunit D [Acidobacteriota bacterium]
MSTNTQLPEAGEGLSPELIEAQRVETVIERVSDDRMVVNMGPQHPSTHGVLRMVVTLDGERVVKVDPVLGYLHRGMEKLAEVKTYNQYIPWTDRWDYLANLQNNVAFAMTVEKMMDLEVPVRARRLRLLACELARISAHLVFLGTHAIDIGALSVFFWGYREREKLLSFFEMICGARITTSYTRIGGVMRDLPPGMEDALKIFLREFPKSLDEVETMLTRNKIWMERTKEVGAISSEQAVSLGITGPILRATGVEYDVRKAFPYLDYDEFDFDVPVGSVGDVYDRYLVRVEEMRQSCRICLQLLDKLEPGPIEADDGKVVLPSKERVLSRMEDLIHQFMIVTEGPVAPAGEVYQAIEGSKGELGLYLVSEGLGRAYRMRIRGPSFVNMGCLAPMGEGGLVADLVAIVASLDPVLGEVDR